MKLSLRRLPVPLAALPCVLACGATGAAAADLDIEVRGIQTRTGQVQAALFADAEDFSADLAFRAMITREGEIKIGVFTDEGRFPRPPAARASVPAKTATVHLRMTDLAPGTYALALYHDVNGDGKVDTNFEGRPLEPWGMSNNPRPSGRKPVWDDAKFELPADGASLVIDLH
ncbi:MAG TPA: DUF2141 domain-containing protein [Burkholderiales bacterium]|nr:DUF2141 domain-containing protein [Burkholderiales bacterium]